MYEAQQTISKIALEEARLNQLKQQREEEAKNSRSRRNNASQQAQVAQTQPPNQILEQRSGHQK